jgi:glycerol-3-phosphate dehydrogenase (NAD(P)+)
MDEALKGADLVILAVPSQTMRQNVRWVEDCLEDSIPIVSVAKGLEMESCKQMSQVIAEELDGSLTSSICVLSGPNIAQETAQGLHSVGVVAAQSMAVAERVRYLTMSRCFCLFTSNDVVGVELGGALKNVVALGAGISDGLGYGDNAKAALITRGLAEITALGATMKADPFTFAGLACLGDIIATCYSPFSRNHYVGVEIAKGRPLKEIMDSMPHVAEGVNTTLAVQKLAQKQGIDMPLTGMLYRILYEGLDLKQAAAKFMKPQIEEETALIKESPHPSKEKWNKSRLAFLPRPTLDCMRTY